MNKQSYLNEDCKLNQNEKLEAEMQSRDAKKFFSSNYKIFSSNFECVHIFY